MLQRNESLSPLENVTLEISLKPFIKKDETSIRNLFNQIFHHWYSLLKYSKVISMLFWIGDGSEIFEFTGNLDTTFEWGKWLGFANEPYPISEEDDPHHESLIGYPRVYRQDAPDFTYRDLQRIVRILKEEGEKIFHRTIRAGATIDPGPEFVPSPFKYQRHPEILGGNGFQGGGCGKNIDCTAAFHEDHYPYAGFPWGIPEGTPFGTFLGRQTRIFMETLGFDFIWFSNSFGFGRCPYSFGGLGEFFDGKEFKIKNNRECKEAVLNFWRYFREECPNHWIETRGTDFPVGMDWVNHASPYKELYEKSEYFRLVPPPNTPWSALTSNYGIAIAGYMSRIAAFPGNFLYRFYTSDPWWCNTPWLDRYERSPHDLFLNLSIAKIDSHGEIRVPNRISFLSIDDSWGNIPEEIPDEVIPHIKQAFASLPDRPSPMIWLYPFDEYNSYTFEHQERIGEVYMGDLLIQEAINCGLPLNTVVSTKNFLQTYQQEDLYAGSILVSILPDQGTQLEQAVLDRIQRGQSFLFYGPTRHASPILRKRLGIQLVSSGLEGEGSIRLSEIPDEFTNGTLSLRYCHQTIISGGPLEETFTDFSNAVCWAIFQQGGERRCLAIVRPQPEGGYLAWVRGSSSADLEHHGLKSRWIRTWVPSECFKSEFLLRYVLNFMGYKIEVSRSQPDNLPINWMCHRHQNGFIFTLFSLDSSSHIHLRFPQGIPILEGMETSIRKGRAIIPIAGFLRRGCRIFLAHMEEGKVSLHRILSKHYRYRYRLMLRGLKQTTVRYYPPSDQIESCQILLNPNEHIFTNTQPFQKRLVQDSTGIYYELPDLSGSLSVAWW